MNKRNYHKITFVSETAHVILCLALFGNTICRFIDINLRVPGITFWYHGCPYLYVIFKLVAWHILFERRVLPKNREMVINCDVSTLDIYEWLALRTLLPDFSDHCHLSCWRRPGHVLWLSKRITHNNMLNFLNDMVAWKIVWPYSTSHKLLVESILDLCTPLKIKRLMYAFTSFWIISFQMSL